MSTPRNSKNGRAVEKELRARLGQQASVAELGRRALAGAGLPALMEEAVRLVTTGLSVEFCEVLELLHGGAELLLRAGVGWGESLIGVATIGTDAGSQIGHALLGGDPVIVVDLREETRFRPPPLLVERGVVSCMSVRIEGEPGPFGVLCAHTAERRAFTRDDANFLKAVANVLAAAIERRRDEDALRLGERRLRDVIDGLFAFVGVLTPDGTLVEANRAALLAAGLRPEEVIGLPFEQTYWWSYSPEAQARLRDAIGRAARGESSRFDALNRIAEDRFITVDFMLAPLFDEEGHVTRLVASGVDITERKLAEERIRQQAALLDVAHDAIFVRDLEDHILYWNRGAEQLYGWTAAEAVGRQADGLLFREPSPRIKEAKRALLRRGEWRGEVNQVTKDGRDIIVESRWTLVRDERGAPRAKLVVNTDVTEKRRLENELLRASHLSLIGELAAGLAHEIKNPLAGIKGAVDILIRRRQQGDPEVEVLEDVRHAVGRIDQTVLALLQRTRPRPLQLAAASLDEVAHRAVLLSRHHAAKASSDGRQVSVAFEPCAEPVVLAVDAAQMEDAVLNLILNGIEAVEGDGRVVVRVRRDAPEGAGARGEAVIEVEDTGRGIEACDRERVFSPFHTTTEGGTGLGLPAVRRIARAHNGRVEVRSAPGHGSTFIMHLPFPAET